MSNFLSNLLYTPDLLVPNREIYTPHLTRINYGATLWPDWGFWVFDPNINQQPERNLSRDNTHKWTINSSAKIVGRSNLGSGLYVTDPKTDGQGASIDTDHGTGNWTWVIHVASEVIIETYGYSFGATAAAGSAVAFKHSTNAGKPVYYTGVFVNFPDELPWHRQNVFVIIGNRTSEQRVFFNGSFIGTGNDLYWTGQFYLGNSSHGTTVNSCYQMVAFYNHALDDISARLLSTKGLTHFLEPRVPFFAPPQLSEGQILVVQNALNGHAAQSPALTQANVLGVSEALHSHAAQSPALTQANVLGVSEALHSHAAESPQLSAGQMLIAQDALHSHAAESPALTQAGVLGVAEALHSHVAESPTLMFGQVLIVSDSWHDLISENVALTQASVLLVDAALHVHSVDSLVIIPGFTLEVAEALHVHAAENPVLITGDSLLPDDALHLHNAGDPTLLTKMILRVDNSWHGHMADNVIFAGLDIGVGCLLFAPLRDAHYYSDIAETIFSVKTCN